MKEIGLIWHTEKRKLSEVKGYEKNPRKITEKNKQELEKSLKKFNIVDIPAINLDNTVLSGNQRIKILHELYGPDFKIDVRVPNRQLIQEEIEEYNLYGNTHMGDWDENMLNFIPLKRLKKFGFDSGIRKLMIIREDVQIIETEDSNIETDQKSKYLQNRMMIKIGGIEFYLKKEDYPEFKIFYQNKFPETLQAIIIKHLREIINEIRID